MELPGGVNLVDVLQARDGHGGLGSLTCTHEFGSHARSCRDADGLVVPPEELDKLGLILVTAPWSIFSNASRHA